MKTYLDLLEERGRRKGRIKGKIETIQTVALLRFSEFSERLTSLLKKLDDLKLLEQIRLFILTAPALLDVENFAESLMKSRPKRKRVVRKQAA